MLRTHHCGELRLGDIGKQSTVCGWVQKSRDLGGMTFIDLRDRYGVIQILFNMDENPNLCLEARKLGREYVIQVSGTVNERSNKNPKMPTGDIELLAASVLVLNESKTPPFLIEDDTDGGEELRAKYRYLDLRRNVLRKNLEFRHRMMHETRNYLSTLNFIEVETPVLIKSTPEGARDFIVPSRMNPGQFYALPQSPQTFKQLLMVSGFDRYFQIVKCFRDEDLRADRQPEFTQIDCEMSFVTREDVLVVFEGLIRHLFSTCKGIVLPDFPRMQYAEAMGFYGSDKPDLRFAMRFVDIARQVKGKNFKVFDEAERVLGICATGCANYTRKEIDDLTDFVKKPQIGASGLVYIRYLNDGTVKSSVDKFYSQSELMGMANAFGAVPGDLMLILAGEENKTLKALGNLRLEMGSRLGLRKNDHFAPLWVVDFPLFDWDDETQRFYAMHHPFTAPNEMADLQLIRNEPGEASANAYDMVINGVEVGGGSIRIHDKQLQNAIFSVLGFTQKEADDQFGFLMNAFEYGAPPHGGIAFGFDRLCAMLTGADIIRDVIAFPKNTSGRDVMVDCPSPVSEAQLKELNIDLKG